MSHIKRHLQMESLHFMKSRARGIAILRSSAAQSQIDQLMTALSTLKNESLILVEQRDYAFRQIAAMQKEQA